MFFGGDSNRVRSLLICLWLLLLPVTACGQDLFSEGLLFRLHRSGVADSYLFGTMHSEDPRVVALPTEVQQVFDSSHQVVLEVQMDAEALIVSMTAMLLTDGRDLRSVLGDSLYRRCLEAAEKRGIPDMALQRYKPWAIATMLSLPPMETGQFLDLVLYQNALETGKQIAGLETAAEQLGTFDRLSEQDQITFLEDTLNNLDQMPTLYIELLESYLRRDLGALVELSGRIFEGSHSDAVARFQEFLVFDRNRRMLARLLPYLEKGSVFAAVGALHLPGQKGMLNLLQQNGYRVERVY